MVEKQQAFINRVLNKKKKCGKLNFIAIHLVGFYWVESGGACTKDTLVHTQNLLLVLVFFLYFRVGITVKLELLDDCFFFKN